MTDKQLTPMQELINDLQDNEPKYYERNYNYLHNLLEQEKQVIEDAFEDGFNNMQYTSAQDYYNNKFKND